MLKQFVNFLKMVKIEHSVFALPFALTSALMAAGGLPETRKILWIIIAMVGARSAAMSMNRIIDRKIDALNPRTMKRELPAGIIPAGHALFFALLSFAVMVLAAYELNPLCLKLSPAAVLVLIAYSYTKRFTWASHAVLGLAISFGPLGAWAAVRGTLQTEAFILAAAVLFWLAGFDILYALQDLEFDRKHGLYSIPSRFGIRKSLYLAKGCHFLTVALLAAVGRMLFLGAAYWVGILVIAALFVYEHSLVKENDLRRLDIAFFNMNSWISLSIFGFTALNYLFR
jgi:4-hydroxybenzoate polyprenyltransferase